MVAGKPGMYALLIRLRARGKGSGIDTDAEVANVVQMRDGQSPGWRCSGTARTRCGPRAREER